MNCGTDCCQVEIIVHSPSVGSRMLVPLQIQMQLHVKEGVSVKDSLMDYTGYAYMHKRDGAIPQLAVGVIRRSF